MVLNDMLVGERAHVCVHVCVCMCVRTCECMFLYVCAMHVCTCVCVCMRVCVYECVRVLVCTCVYTSYKGTNKSLTEIM